MDFYINRRGKQSLLTSSRHLYFLHSINYEIFHYDCAVRVKYLRPGRQSRPSQCSCANLPVKALWNVSLSVTQEPRKASSVAFPTLSSVWAHLLLAASIIWLSLVLPWIAASGYLLSSPSPVPFPPENNYGRILLCILQLPVCLLQSKYFLAETVKHCTIESFGRPLRLPRRTICVRKNVWLHPV